jgi:hypothetical protein
MLLDSSPLNEWDMHFQFFYASYGWEDEWRSPKTMEEAIALVDRFDEKVMLKDITEQMASDRECCVM